MPTLVTGFQNMQSLSYVANLFRRDLMALSEHVSSDQLRDVRALTLSQLS